MRAQLGRPRKIRTRLRAWRCREIIAAGETGMAQKRIPTMSEQRRKVDWLRSEMQKPAVMKNPQRLALLKEALAESQALLKAQRMREK
jgi:hypothetical protein